MKMSEADVTPREPSARAPRAAAQVETRFTVFPGLPSSEALQSLLLRYTDTNNWLLAARGPEARGIHRSCPPCV